MINATTGEKLKEAHGGQGKVVALEIGQDIPQYSVIRRQITGKK